LKSSRLSFSTDYNAENQREGQKISQIATLVKLSTVKEEEKDKTLISCFRSFLASQTEGQFFSFFLSSFLRFFFFFFFLFLSFFFLSFFLFDGTEDSSNFLGLTVLIYQRFIKLFLSIEKKKSETKRIQDF
jgi:hypothetical protein